ncbi:MAG: tetratricopeptide repeat protein [Candidatus Aminicenantales bacterium]
MMKKEWFVVCAALLILAFSGRGLYAQEGRGQGRLIGSVVDEARNPIEGAKITLEYAQYAHKLTTFSNSKGMWGFIGLGLGEVTVKAEKEGYVESIIQLRISGLSTNPTQKIVLQKITDSTAAAGLSDASKDLLLKGNVLFEEMKYVEALALYQEFIKENPKLYQVRLNVGNCYVELQKFDEAIAEYQKVLEELNAEPADKKNPKLMAQLYSGIGEAYLRQNKFKEAEEYFVKSIGIDPSDHALAYNVAEIMMNAGNIDEAIRYYEMAIRIKPDWPKSYLKLGYAWLNKGDIQKAIEAFNTVIEISPPDDPDAALARDIIKSISKIK